MLALKYVVLNGILVGVIQLFSEASFAEVLELGASELHGKSDQPGAMTFISRAAVDLSIPLVKWKATEKIKQEIDNEIFRATPN